MPLFRKFLLQTRQLSLANSRPRFYHSTLALRKKYVNHTQVEAANNTIQILFQKKGAQLQKTITAAEKVEEKLESKTQLLSLKLLGITLAGMALEFVAGYWLDFLSKREIEILNNELINTLLAINLANVQLPHHITDEFTDKLNFPSATSFFQKFLNLKFLSLGYVIKSFVKTTQSEVNADIYVANLLILQNQMELAESILDYALGEDTNSAEAYFSKILIAFKQGNITEIKKLQKKLKKLEETQIKEERDREHQEKARPFLASSLRYFTFAISEVEIVIEGHKKNLPAPAWVDFLEAKTLAQEGEKQKAIHKFNEITEKDYHKVSHFIKMLAYLELAEIALTDKNYNQARKHFIQVDGYHSCSQNDTEYKNLSYHILNRLNSFKKSRLHLIAERAKIGLKVAAGKINEAAIIKEIEAMNFSDSVKSDDEKKLYRTQLAAIIQEYLGTTHQFKLTGVTSVPTTPYEYATLCQQREVSSADWEEKSFPTDTNWKLTTGNLKIFYHPGRKELILVFTHHSDTPNEQDKNALEELKKQIAQLPEKDETLQITTIGFSLGAVYADYAQTQLRAAFPDKKVRYIGFNSSGKIGFLAHQESLVQHILDEQSPFDRIDYLTDPDKGNTHGPHGNDTVKIQLLPPQYDQHWLTKYLLSGSFLPAFMHNFKFSPVACLIASVEAALLYNWRFYPDSLAITDIPLIAPSNIPGEIVAPIAALLLWGVYKLGGVAWLTEKIPGSSYFHRDICFCTSCQHRVIFGKAPHNMNDILQAMDKSTGQIQPVSPLSITKWPQDDEAYGKFLRIAIQQNGENTASIPEKELLLTVYQAQPIQRTFYLSQLSNDSQHYLAQYLQTNGISDLDAMPQLLRFSLKNNKITILSTISAEYFCRYIEYRTQQLKAKQTEAETTQSKRVNNNHHKNTDYFTQRCAFFAARITGSERIEERPTIGTRFTVS